MMKGIKSIESNHLNQSFRNKQKYVFLLALIVCWVIQVQSVTFGQVVWVDGGLVGDVLVDGTNEYQEVTFITGEPVVLKGTVTYTLDNQGYVKSADFSLANAAKNMTLSRSVTYTVTTEERPTASGNNTIYSRVINEGNYDETIVAGGNTYTLTKFKYTESKLIDNTPAVDYFSGFLSFERTFAINGDANANGYVEYTIEGDPLVGYSHEWGKQDTEVIHHEIHSYVPNPDYDPEVYRSKAYNEWTGVVDTNMASTQEINFVYQGTNPQNISFRGSYFKTSSEENVLTYDYDLPLLNGGAVDYTSDRRNKGDDSLSDSVLLSSNALIAPKLRDIGGHWAEDNIFLTTSLELFDTTKEYFAPDSMISRIEFGKAIVKAINGNLPEFTSTDAYKQLRPGVETPYLDVFPMKMNGEANTDYNYYQYIKDNNIMSGENSYFKPNEPVTRAQAVVIMINALGLQYNAPAPPYRTTFNDDARIPSWARDSIYMANEIGIVSGDLEGNFNADKNLTKAEAAAMLVGFINHIKDDITYDYREKIIN